MTRTIYEGFNEQTLRATEITIDSESGLPIIVHSQNTRPIVESAKALASNFDRHRRNRDGFTHVARIPGVIYQQLTKLGITRDAKAFDAWLNSREARLLRTDDGRKL